MASTHPQPGAILRCEAAFRLLEPGKRYELEARDSRLVVYLRDTGQPLTGDDRHTVFMATWHIAEALESGALIVESDAATPCGCS